MSKLLYVGTYGTDDPTRATMPFIGAVGALKRGHEPSIVMMGESVYMFLGDIVDRVHGVGFPPLRQLLDQLVDAKVPIHI
jgi:predicted peroxiredoxin